MDIVAVFGSTNAFVRIILIFVNIPVCVICWQLIPRLAPDAKRLAIGFLAQMVIVVPLEIQPSSSLRSGFGIRSGMEHPQHVFFHSTGAVGGVAPC